MIRGYWGMHHLFVPSGGQPWFNRYLAMCGDDKTTATLEEMDIEEAGYKVHDNKHRNYDRYMEGVQNGTLFRAIFAGVPSARRRHDSRLGVSRLPLLDCCGAEREKFYQQRLFIGLAWYCDEKPVIDEDADGKPFSTWKIRWCPPRPEQINGVVFPEQVLTITNQERSTAFSFELACKEFEALMSDPEADLLCPCCAQAIHGSPCAACRYAMGFHYCINERSHRRGFMVWPQGCLHNSKVDGQRVIWNLHRRRLPTDVLEKTINRYIEDGSIDQGDAERMFKCIQQERGEAPIVNNADGFAGSDAEDNAGGGNGLKSRKLTHAQMEALLEKRVGQLQAGAPPGTETDQFRVYKFITEGLLQSDKPLRIMVQASAGTKGGRDRACGRGRELNVSTEIPRHWQKLLAVDAVPVVSRAQIAGEGCCAHRPGALLRHTYRVMSCLVIVRSEESRPPTLRSKAATSARLRFTTCSTSTAT